MSGFQNSMVFGPPSPRSDFYMLEVLMERMPKATPGPTAYKLLCRGYMLFSTTATKPLKHVQNTAGLLNVDDSPRIRFAASL